MSSSYYTEVISRLGRSVKVTRPISTIDNIAENFDCSAFISNPLVDARFGYVSPVLHPQNKAVKIRLVCWTYTDELGPQYIKFFARSLAFKLSKSMRVCERVASKQINKD